MVEAIGTAKTGMQEGLNKVLPQEEGEPLLVFLMSQCYCISGVVSQNKKLVHKVFPQNAVFENQRVMKNFPLIFFFMN